MEFDRGVMASRKRRSASSFLPSVAAMRPASSRRKLPLGSPIQRCRHPIVRAVEFLVGGVELRQSCQRLHAAVASGARARMRNGQPLDSAGRSGAFQPSHAGPPSRHGLS